MRKLKKLVLSFSSINEWRLCPRRGHMLSTLGYQKLGYKSHPNLYLGKAGHKALEQIYLGKPVSFTALDGEFGLPPGNTLERLITDYVTTYQAAKGYDSQFDVIAIENLYEVNLVDNIYLRGHVDVVCRTRSGELAVMDHKFSTNPGRYILPKIDVSEQLSGYCWLVSQALKEPVTVVGFNGIGLDPKLRGTERFARGWTYRTDWQIQEYVTNVTYWARQIKAWLESGFVPTDCEHGRNSFNTNCPLIAYCDEQPSQRPERLLSDYEIVDNDLNAVIEWEP